MKVAPPTPSRCQQLPCETPAALAPAPVLGDTAASRTGVDMGLFSPWVPPLRMVTVALPWHCGGGVSGCTDSET